MPSLIRQDDLLLRLVKDVNDIRTALRRTVANLPLFDISNENTPTVLTASQNDYVPGNYDVLRLATTAAISITGFRGGLKGRFLRLFNVGLYEITIPHRSASSALGNRVRSATGQSIVLNPGGELLLYYDIVTQEWLSSFASNADRISCQLRRTVDYSIADSEDYNIEWQTAVVDTGGFWNATEPTDVVIPETGWYDFNLQVVWEGVTGSSAPRYNALIDENLYFLAVDGRPSAPSNVEPIFISLSRRIYRQKGSRIKAYAFHMTAAGTKILASLFWFTGTGYTELSVAKA